MRFLPLPLLGAYCIENEPFADKRGEFSRIFCAEEFASIGLGKPIVQTNISLTYQKGSVRGMHFQHPPFAETKIIRCLNGAVFDVIIDLRKGSETFLQWHGEVLTPETNKAIYIPEGFAHGFQVLEKNSQLLYMHTNYYTPANEGGVRFNDTAFNIQWPLPTMDISDKDKQHPLIDEGFQGLDI